MTSIILPRRALVQPQGAEILSASDGTWQAEFVHGFANGADLTGHGYTLQTGTSVVHEAYERGVRAYINNHAAGAAADIAISRGLYVAASEPFFSVVQYRTDSGSDGSGGLLCLRNTSANPICSMFVGQNGITGLAGSATFIVRDSSGSLSRHETTTAVNDGLMHTSAVRRFNGRWQWSLDGSPWANFATSPTNAQGAITFTPDRMFYGREPTGTAIGNVFQGFFEFGMVGRGTLNDAQIATVHQNPWLLFKPSPRRLYFSLPAAPGGDITGTISAAESGTDVCTAVGVVRVSGAIASAESVADAASSAGEVLVSGVVAVAEVGVDHASLSGAIMVAGDLSAVEQGADQAALVGSVLISGSFAAFEIGSDAASMSGQVLVSGDVSASESTVDAASLAGSVEVSGVLAAIESGQDTAVITGGGVVSPVVGIVAAVESGADVAALAGTVLVSGVTAASESESDQAGISGAVHVSGSVSAAEGQLDTAHVMGRVLVSGVIASTEAANDSASVNGSSTTITSGVIAAAEAGADAAFIPGAVFVSGNAAAFEQGADIVVAAGVVRITGAIAANEVGTDTATILSLPRDMTPRAGYIAGAAIRRAFIAGTALQRRYVA